MGCGALVMRKSTRAGQVELPNKLRMPQNPALGGGDKINCEMGVAFAGTMPCDALASLAMISGRHP